MLRCNKRGCPEEGEANAFCCDPRCREFLTASKGVDGMYGPKTPIYVCPIHLGEAIETLQREGQVRLLCDYCQGPWCIVVNA